MVGMMIGGFCEINFCARWVDGGWVPYVVREIWVLWWFEKLWGSGLDKIEQMCYNVLS